MRLYLIRHAPIEPAHRGRIVGRSDVAAALPAPLAPGVRPWPEACRVLASPARRARETASWLGFQGWDEDPDWWEQDHGAWEGETWDAVLARDPRARAYLEAYDRLRPPEGEHLGDVRRRVAAALARAVASEPDRDTVVVAHAGPIRCVVADALEVPTLRAAFLDVEPLSLSVLTRTPGGFRVSQLNVPLAVWAAGPWHADLA